MIICGMSLFDIGTRHHDFHAHGAQMKDFFLTHLVWNDEDKLVTLLGCNQRQGKTGIPGCCLDQRISKFQFP